MTDDRPAPLNVQAAPLALPERNSVVTSCLEPSAIKRGVLRRPSDTRLLLRYEVTVQDAEAERDAARAEVAELEQQLRESEQHTKDERDRLHAAHSTSEAAALRDDLYRMTKDRDEARARIACLEQQLDNFLSERDTHRALIEELEAELRVTVGDNYAAAAVERVEALIAADKRAREARADVERHESAHQIMLDHCRALFQLLCDNGLQDEAQQVAFDAVGKSDREIERLRGLLLRIVTENAGEACCRGCDTIQDPPHFDHDADCEYMAARDALSEGVEGDQGGSPGPTLDDKEATRPVASPSEDA